MAEAGEVEAGSASVVRKVRAILDAFEGRQGPLGLSELARRSGLAKTSVHRLAGELVEVGLLDRQGRAYQLGALLFTLGQRVPRMRALRLLATRHLEELAIVTRETVVLAFPGDTDVLFGERYYGQGGGGAAVTAVEGRVPFHCGASGKVLLAFGAEGLRRRVLAAPLAPRTRWTVVDAAVLESQLETVRRTGHAVERQELVPGYGAVGAPVLLNGVAVAAVTVVAPIARLDPRRLAPDVVTAAQTLTADVAPVTP